MTDGSDIIGSLLLADADIGAIVPEDQTKAGRLPEGIGLPALLLRLVSTVERQALVRGATTRTVDRVAVTVRAANHRQRKQLMHLVVRCCAGRTGAIGGGVNVSVLTAGAGPDIDGPGNSFERTQDFRVSYDAT